MNPTLLEPPMQRSAPETPPPRPPSVRTRRAPAREREGRRALALGLVASVLLHAALFLFFREAGIEPSRGQTPPPPAEPASGMQVVQVVESPSTPDASAPEPASVREPPAADAAPAPPREAPAAERPPARPAPAARGAERITPGARDPRIWAMPDALDAMALSPEDIRRIELLARLSVLGDSLALAELQALARFDWTVEDESGGKWGVSPGKIHLGDITLPLPLRFGGPTYGTGYEGTAEDWRLIQEQAQRIGIEEDIQARIRAIRERKDAERRQRGGTGNDP